MWKQPFSTDTDQPKLLIADVHKAQTTEIVRELLRGETHTSLVLVPPGCTSLVQPLDVCFSKEFKSISERLQNGHMHSNLDKYVNSTIPAGQSYILITKWVGAARAKMNKK